jgi:hypothetical protein
MTVTVKATTNGLLLQQLILRAAATTTTHIFGQHSQRERYREEQIGKRTMMIKYTCKQLNIQFTYLTVFFFNPRPVKNMGRPYRPSASVCAARRSKTKAIK